MEAERQQRIDDLLFDSFRRNSRIVSDGNLAAAPDSFFMKPQTKTGCQIKYGFIRQLNGLVRRFNGNASDIGPAF